MNWRTEQEINLNYFVIEHSKDGVNYSNLAIVFTKSSSNNTYSYKDMDPYASNYYRLKMVDMDGSFKYSEVKIVRFTANANENVSIFPNPAVNYFNMQLEGFAKGDYNMQVTNTYGQVVLTKRVRVIDGVLNDKIDMPGVAAGVYHVTVTSDDRKVRVTSQLVKR